MLDVRLIGDASRNVVLHVRGVADQAIAEPQLIFSMDQLAAQSKAGRGYIKISSAWWLIQEKALIRLLWSKNKEDIVFPMESRNAISFHRFVDPPADWGKELYMQLLNLPTGGASFAFCLDFDR